jgi:hypothetical protein
MCADEAEAQYIELSQLYSTAEARCVDRFRSVPPRFLLPIARFRSWHILYSHHRNHLVLFARNAP